MIVVLAAVLGVVLIERHHVLIGALILALAATRAMILIALRRRRALFRTLRRGRFGPRR